MTDRDRELMQQALEALDSGVDVQMGRVVWTEYDSELVEQAITALRERLAQPEKADPQIVWCDCGDGITPNSGAKCGNCLAAEAASAQPEQAAMSFYDGNGRRFAHLPARTHWEGCEEVHPECKKPEFIKHEEGGDGWSDWVCPDPDDYLIKCCDCGLVHEAQFRVVKYAPAPSEECEIVNDPNLQAVFRMRRSERWTPDDTAYRPGGLAQPEQEPVAWMDEFGNVFPLGAQRGPKHLNEPMKPLYTTPPQRKPLTDEEIMDNWLKVMWAVGDKNKLPIPEFARAIEQAHNIKGEA